MSAKSFIGRKKELAKLKAVHERHLPSLVVIKGRRRIGKSRLITEFAAQNQKRRFWSFVGLAPKEETTAQMQRDYFARKLALNLKIPPMTFSDWSDAFCFLSEYVKAGDIVLFDEISWMAAKDITFIPKLKAWWDEQIVHFLLVLCGSVSTWIEENILNSTAFFGRIALTITLEPLSIKESSTFLQLLGFKGAPFDYYKLLAVLGGVPWYLEQINPQMMAEENIRQLCFHKDGLLVLEFNRIFHDLFNGKGLIYKKILESLKEGMKTLVDIRTDIGYGQSGTLSQMMENLIIAGFVTKHGLWSIKTEQSLKQSLYRISDPYIRFYLKVIEQNRQKIDRGVFDEMPMGEFPGFEAHMGLQVECLLLQNRVLLLEALGIHPSECSFDGPYRQTKTLKTKGCQIDYLIQTRMKNIFLCEFKFKRRELGLDIIDEVKEKMNRLKLPRGYALVPVLFHLGGVQASVYEKQYFYRIIDIGDFLENM